MEFNRSQLAPIIGEFYTSLTTTFFPEDHYPQLVLSTSEINVRFAVKLGDDGLENIGLRAGDYLIFRQQGWPTEHGQVCFIQFGDDAIIRVIPDIWAAEIELLAENDKYPAISTHRNQFVVTGVLCGVIRPDDHIRIFDPFLEGDFNEW